MDKSRLAPQAQPQRSDTHRKPSLTCVVGARPNFVKIGPILSALDAAGHFDVSLVHTGQHYDEEMNDSFFSDLGIRRPDVNLGVGSGTHATQTADIMRGFEQAVDAHRPTAVLVVGDVNSTLAAALVASKKHIPVIHVEAGLRSYDRAMPEEINRVLTDQISDFLFVTEREAIGNLIREGIAESRIHFVGNVMIDALQQSLPRAVPAAETLATTGIDCRSGFAVATLHRPSNVDNPDVLRALIDEFGRIGRDRPVVFPVHPRTRQRLDSAGLGDRLRGPVYAIPPVSYLKMLGLLAGASLVLTDSGGLQEETTALGIPCFTLREQTERPITVSQGTSTIVGNDPERLRAAYADLQTTGGKKGRRPELWDGHAAERIAAILARSFSLTS